MTSQALIIEDDLDTASLFSHILEFIGFTTEIIRSGEQAVSRLKETVPDIVLLDILLGQNVTGINILDYIKGEKRLSTSRVIVITGYPNLAESVGNKADLVLLKPISAKQLSTMVLRLCPNHVYENFLYTASHDAMTGLMNYARFKDRLSHSVSRAKRTDGLLFAVLFIQILGLDEVQNTHGQLIVNQVLLTFVEKVWALIREIDTFSRLSEDKFAILLENIKDPSNASRVAERIQKDIRKPMSIQGQRISIDSIIEITQDDLIEQLDTYMKIKITRS
jgi:diguanylate cyclase (GGDEF)-like protein